MRKISCPAKFSAALSVLLFSFVVYAQAEYTALEHVIANLLIDEEIESQRLGAKIIYNENITDERFHDMLAYRLQSGVANVNRANVDTYAWLIKALGNSGNGRYLNLLKSYSDSFSIKTDKVYAKLSKYLDISIEQLEGRSGDNLFNVDQYDQGKVSAAITKTNSSIAFKKDHLAKARLKQNLEEVYSILGRPSSISSSSAKAYTGPFISPGSRQQVRLNYEGAGFVTVAPAKGNYQIVNIYQFRYLDVPIENTSMHNLASRLVGENIQDVRYAANAVLRDKMFEPPLLDAIATRIWNNKNTRGRYQTDGIKLLCRILGESGESRFRSLLEATANETTNKKIKRYIGKVLEQLADDKVDQFEIPAA